MFLVSGIGTIDFGASNVEFPLGYLYKHNQTLYYMISEGILLHFDLQFTFCCPLNPY